MAGRASARTTIPGLTILPLPSESSTPDAGRQAIAARIHELAEAHGMKLSQDADLTHLLRAIHVNDPIPIAAFAVVADILFAILSANQRHSDEQETLP
jgi:flagellar biosynthesis protein